ncbi:WD40 repeat domain-containing protein, partial [Kibdelosporangium lantanae]
VATGPGGLVTFADATGSAELWSVGGNVHQLSSVSGHNGPAGQVVISPDGHTLATGGADGTVRLWNIEDPTEPRLTAVLSGHTKPVYGVAFSPDGHTIATSSDDGTVRQS